MNTLSMKSFICASHASFVVHSLYYALVLSFLLVFSFFVRHRAVAPKPKKSDAAGPYSETLSPRWVEEYSDQP